MKWIFDKVFQSTCIIWVHMRKTMFGIDPDKGWPSYVLDLMAGLNTRDVPDIHGVWGSLIITSLMRSSFSPNLYKRSIQMEFWQWFVVPSRWGVFSRVLEIFRGNSFDRSWIEKTIRKLSSKWYFSSLVNDILSIFPSKKLNN